MESELRGGEPARNIINLHIRNGLLTVLNIFLRASLLGGAGVRGRMRVARANDPDSTDPETLAIFASDKSQVLEGSYEKATEGDPDTDQALTSLSYKEAVRDMVRPSCLPRPPANVCTLHLAHS